MQLKRIVCYVGVSTVRALDGIARKSGLSRSEVIRLAFEAGMEKAQKGALRLQKVRRVERVAGDERQALRGWRKAGRSDGSTASGNGDLLDADDAVSQLVEYGESVRQVRGDVSADTLRTALGVHAQVLGVPSDEVEDAVEDAIVRLQVEEQVLPVEDPGKPPE